MSASFLFPSNWEMQTVVEILENDGEWYVRVIEHERETINTFELELFAMAFAEHQRLRLGLKEFDRL
jgi:hypothetical protein